MPREYEEDRQRRVRLRPTNVCYAAWKENPTDENLAALYGALERHARRVMFQRRGFEDEVLIAEMASSVLMQLLKFDPAKSSFSTWAHRSMMCDVFDSVDKAVIESRKKPLTPESVADQSEDVGGLDAARFVEGLLQRLDEPERTIVQGKLDGLTDEEIAENTGLTKKAVERRWAKLRESLNN